MILKDDNGGSLPKKVQDDFNAYIERIKAIQWFKPQSEINKTDLEKQIKFALNCFGVRAKIKYKKLETLAGWEATRYVSCSSSWDEAEAAAREGAWGAAKVAASKAARGKTKDAAWDATRDAAWDATRDATRDAEWAGAWDAARDAAWDAAWDAAMDAAMDAVRNVAWAGAELISMNLKDFTAQYPDGAFLQLIPIWELGLYPVGVVEGEFLVFLPRSGIEFPNIQ